MRSYSWTAAKRRRTAPYPGPRYALQAGATVEEGEGPRRLSVVDCGEIPVPSR